MNEPRGGSRTRMSDDNLAKALVVSAGIEIMEVAADLHEHYGGRAWRPPA